MLREFKEFALRGSVLDLAVGIIIGAAFNSVVNSLVEDILMPPLGLLVGDIPFDEFALPITEEVAIRYGEFLEEVVSFIIMAFAVFLLIRMINRLYVDTREAESEAEPVNKECPYCIQEIPIHASRCPFCTSQLTVSKQVE